jgi:integrase
MKGYIRKRGNAWSFTVDIGRDARTGKRKQKSQSGFKTKKEAQAALAELVNDVEKGNYHEPEKRKFNDFVLEYMKKTYINRVKPSTYDTNERIIMTHIIPFFANVDINDIDQFLVHDFYNEKIKAGFSSHYIQDMHALIRLLLRVAYKWKILKEDIASMLEPPKLKKKEMNVWTIEQVNTFLKFTKHSRYHPIFFLAAYTGMRKGEILGLSWDDINFDERTISVNKTLYRVKSENYLQEPKTPSSIRRIYMDDDIIRVLKKQKVKQNLERLKFGGAYKEHNMVFAQETGEMVNPNAVNGLYGRFIKQAGLPHIRFHDLRHTHATILLQMGINPKVVAERLGHASVRTTLDVYSHVTSTMKKDLSKQFTSAMKSGHIPQVEEM